MRMSSFLHVVWCSFALTSTGRAADYFVVPEDSILYLKPMGGSAGGDGEFGLGTSIANHQPVFQGLPNHPLPNEEVLIGFVRGGTPLHFYQKIRWQNKTYWGFSNSNDELSLVSFYDLDNSLGFGGTTVQSVGEGLWLLHLDNPASILYDDDDNDLYVQIRLIPFGR